MSDTEAPTSSAEARDEAAVELLAQRMSVKLAKQRRKGYSGWEECGLSELCERLIEHAIKGDPVDVANFAAFISANNRPHAAVRKAMREAFLSVAIDQLELAYQQ